MTTNHQPPVDVANEPVDLTQDDGGFMDTGVLHDERICNECGNDLACQGYQMCSECLEKLGHEGR